jgi:hypothetical protein
VKLADGTGDHVGLAVVEPCSRQHAMAFVRVTRHCPDARRQACCCWAQILLGSSSRLFSGHGAPSRAVTGACGSPGWRVALAAASGDATLCKVQGAWCMIDGRGGTEYLQVISSSVSAGRVVRCALCFVLSASASSSVPVSALCGWEIGRVGLETMGECGLSIAIPASSNTRCHPGKAPVIDLLSAALSNRAVSFNAVAYTLSRAV